MTNRYLEPQDDGILMRPMKDWAAEKLDYLERYLAMFTISMRSKPWRALNYIDLFAGPGKCRHEDTSAVHLGSPLLALTTNNAFDHYYFVDWDAENIAGLQQRCQHSPYADRIQYFEDDSNTAIEYIADEIRCIDASYKKGVWSCLNLAFLDPEGLELNWDTVKRLAEFRTDLVIHYSQNGIQRNLSKCIDNAEETILDRFFGSYTWREIYQQAGGQSSVYGELINFYKQNLYDLDYVEIKSGGDELWRAPLMRNTKNAPLYYLIFASKHPLGEKFWREVTARNVYGQRRMF